MKRIVHWIARTTDDLAGIDVRFSSLEGRHVFDAGWVGGKVIVSAEEVAAIRHSLYLIYLLAWVATAPIVTFLAIITWSGDWGTPSAAFWSAVIGAVSVFVAALSLAPYPYMAMAIRGKPSFHASDLLSDNASTNKRRRRPNERAP
jgi:hypothetical protein